MIKKSKIYFKHLKKFYKSLWNKRKYLNLNIFRTRCCKPLIFQTQIIWFNRIHSLKYLRSATFASKDIVIRKSEFVAKNSIPLMEKLLGNCIFFYCSPKFHKNSSKIERYLTKRGKPFICIFEVITVSLQISTIFLRILRFI